MPAGLAFRIASWMVLVRSRLAASRNSARSRGGRGQCQLRDADHPAVAFDRQQIAAAAVARGAGEGEDGLPVEARLGDFEARRGVADIDADRGLRRPRAAHGVERCEHERATPGCVDDQVGRDRLPRPVDPLAASTGMLRRSADEDELANETLVADHDVATMPARAVDGVLEQRPRRGIDDPAEIPAGKGSKPGSSSRRSMLTERRGAGRGKVPIEAGEKPAERRGHPTEPMQLAGLRRTRAMRRRIGEQVPFHDDHLLEMLRERTRGREAAHAGSDHQRLPAQQVGHGLISSSVRERANTLRVTRPRYVLQCFRRCSPIDEIGFDCNKILIIGAGT